MILTRRSALALGAAMALAARLPHAVSTAGAGEAAPAGRYGPPEPFRPSLVRERAKALAAQAFVPPSQTLPQSLADLDYDQYRDIRFRPEEALFSDGDSPYTLQLFHLGFGYREPVSINLVSDGQARHVFFDPSMFSYGPLVPEPPTETTDLGFSGFRIHGHINTPDYADEFTVFQGASYFRAVARDQIYGLSARGLAIGTADPSGEEFPTFREFWIEEAAPGDDRVVVHALLDSPSATGAYRFVTRPGRTTTMEVEATLFPRSQIETVGVAPLTSMFYFSPHDRPGIDDFRPAVHDSEGLSIWNGAGEWLWRPLLNPRTLQISMFLDEHPHGFGLMQRARDFRAYQDLEAEYHRRPSLWVEPIGDWGRGSVVLVEIPTPSEVHDNIVAFWRPEAPLEAGESYSLSYRLHWGEGPAARPGVALAARAMVGLAEVGKPQNERTKRVFVIDFMGEGLSGEALAGEPVEAEASATAGELAAPVVKTRPETGGVRVSLEFDPQGAPVAELRCSLRRGGKPVSETWIYRWLA